MIDYSIIEMTLLKKTIIEMTLLKKIIQQNLNELEDLHNRTLLLEEKNKKYNYICENYGIHSNMNEDLGKIEKVKESLSNEMLVLRQILYTIQIPKLIMN